MSSEAITRNDLTAILNEVLPPTPSEYRKLLWTNPNPSSAFAGQTVSVDLSGYDEIILKYAVNNTTDGVYHSVSLKIGTTSFIHSTANYTTARQVVTASNGVTFSNGYYYSPYGSTANANNNYIIPTYIYGIKYERVAPPQVEYEWEEITPLTVTVTTGSTGQQLHAYRRGRMLFFSLSGISRAANTSSGANFWVANVSGLPASFINSVGCAYYDEKNIFVHFQSTSETTATITARVTGGTLNANSVVGSITTMTLFSS